MKRVRPRRNAVPASAPRGCPRGHAIRRHHRKQLLNRLLHAVLPLIVLYCAASNFREGAISTTHISAVQWPGDLFEYVHTSPRVHWPRSFAIATILRITGTCRLRAARCNAVYPEASSSELALYSSTTYKKRCRCFATLSRTCRYTAFATQPTTANGPISTRLPA